MKTTKKYTLGKVVSVRLKKEEARRFTAHLKRIKRDQSAFMREIIAKEIGGAQ